MTVPLTRALIEPRPRYRRTWRWRICNALRVLMGIDE